MATETTPKVATKTVEPYTASPYKTKILQDNGQPTCSKCGSGFRTDLSGQKFCPRGEEDCPMLGIK